MLSLRASAQRRRTGISAFGASAVPFRSHAVPFPVAPVPNHAAQWRGERGWREWMCSSSSVCISDRKLPHAIGVPLDASRFCQGAANQPDQNAKASLPNACDASSRSVHNRHANCSVALKTHNHVHIFRVITNWVRGSRTIALPRRPSAEKRIDLSLRAADDGGTALLARCRRRLRLDRRWRSAQRCRRRNRGWLRTGTVVVLPGFPKNVTGKNSEAEEEKAAKLNYRRPRNRLACDGRRS